MPYFVLKKVFSERALKAKGYAPWVWRPLPFPFDSLNTFPTSFIAFKAWVKRLWRRFGAGKYRVLRTHFEGEAPGWRSVVMFTVRGDGAFKIDKRYSDHPSHPYGQAQAYWKEPERRLDLTLDVLERLRQRREAMQERMRRELESKRPKRFVLMIEGRTWRVRRR